MPQGRGQGSLLAAHREGFREGGWAGERESDRPWPEMCPACPTMDCGSEGLAREASRTPGQFPEESRGALQAFLPPRQGVALLKGSLGEAKARGLVARLETHALKTQEHLCPHFLA